MVDDGAVGPEWTRSCSSVWQRVRCLWLDGQAAIPSRAEPGGRVCGYWAPKGGGPA